MRRICTVWRRYSNHIMHRMSCAWYSFLFTAKIKHIRNIIRINWYYNLVCSIGTWLFLTGQYSLPWANIKITAYNTFVTKSLNLTMAWGTYNTVAFLCWTCTKIRSWQWTWWWGSWNWVWFLVGNVDVDTNVGLLKEVNSYKRILLIDSDRIYSRFIHCFYQYIETVTNLFLHQVLEIVIASNRYSISFLVNVLYTYIFWG